MCGELAAAHCLAGFCLADLYHPCARRRRAEIMVVTHHAMHFRPRQVEFRSELPDCVVADPPELFHEAVQDLHQHLGTGIEACNDRAGRFPVVFRHHDSTRSWPE